MNRRSLCCGILALGLGGCGGGAPAGIEPTEAMTVPPERVQVDHILIAAKNDRMPRITRTKAEARALAERLLGELRGGADFAKFKHEYSDDGEPGQPRGGPYTMTNSGVAGKPGEIPRTGMVPAFGDVSFGLEVGELGLAPMDPATSPYGYHIIKRLE